MKKSVKNPPGDKKEKKHPNIYAQSLRAVIFSIVILFLFTHTVGRLYEKFERISPNSNKIEDLQLSDLSFAYGQEGVAQDTNIVIVNCSKDSRLALARKLLLIDSFQPKAIGIDMIFSNPGDSIGNEALITAINKINERKQNIVLCVNQTDDNEGATADLAFYQNLLKAARKNVLFNWGFLKKEETNKTLRGFEPYLQQPNGRVNDSSFEVKLLRIACGADSFATMNRECRKWETVNYRKTLEGFANRYAQYDSISDSSKAFAGKIVLMGLDDSALIEDRHYSPLNGSLGRTLPDMFGIEYHAQVLSMIINRDFVRALPFSAFWIFLSCYACMFLFIAIYRKTPALYHYFTDAIIVIAIVPLFIFLSFWQLGSHQIKLEPVDFILPIFSCGFLWHLYEWFSEQRLVLSIKKNIVELMLRKRTKKLAQQTQKTHQDE